jgi:hypothetical protein
LAGEFYVSAPDGSPGWPIYSPTPIVLYIMPTLLVALRGKDYRVARSTVERFD